MTSAGTTTTKPLVIVVDDDDAVRDSLEAVLSAWGYQTQLYASGEAFLDGLDDLNSLDGVCVLLDLHMPGSDGIVIARALRAMAPQCRVVLMSARFENGTRTAANDARVDALIEKPFHDQTLLGAITGREDT